MYSKDGKNDQYKNLFNITDQQGNGNLSQFEISPCIYQNNCNNKQKEIISLGQGKRKCYLFLVGMVTKEVMGNVQKLLKKVKIEVPKVNHQCSGYTANGSEMMSYRQLDPMLTATLNHCAIAKTCADKLGFHP